MNAIEQIKAEIERYKHKADTRLLQLKKRTLLEEAKDIALQNLCGNLLHFIKSLPKEKPSEDLEKEIKEAVYDSLFDLGAGNIGIIGGGGFITIDDIAGIARYFYELGLKARKV